MPKANKFKKMLKDAVLAIRFGYAERMPQGPAVVLRYLLAQSRFVYERIGRGLMWLNGRQRGRLLDVGCGNGAFLLQMQAMGWDVVGYEPDPKAAQVGREQYGLQIFSGSLEDAGFAQDSFDAITMCHVLEHLNHPVQTLKTIWQLLKTSGTLVIATPNIASLGHRLFREAWRGLEPPRHLHLFTPESIRNIVQIAGFEIINVMTYSGSAPQMWAKSNAIKNYEKYPGENPNNVYGKRYKVSGFFFGLLEYLLTVFPFRLSWGEELIVIARKR